MPPRWGGGCLSREDMGPPREGGRGPPREGGGGGDEGPGLPPRSPSRAPPPHSLSRPRENPGGLVSHSVSSVPSFYCTHTLHTLYRVVEAYHAQVTTPDRGAHQPIHGEAGGEVVIDHLFAHHRGTAPTRAWRQAPHLDDGAWEHIQDQADAHPCPPT
jgi:hypothetical protein